MSHSEDLLATTQAWIERFVDEMVPDIDYAALIRSTQPPDHAIDLLPTLLIQSKQPDRQVPILAAWQLLRAAANLFDDAEDGEQDDPVTINLATGLLFTAQLALSRLSEAGVPEKTVLRLLRGFNEASLLACAGQHSDLCYQRQPAGSLDPDRWLSIAQNKSVRLFAWATSVGAVVSEDTEAVYEHLYQLGFHFGVLLQLSDDFSGIWQTADPAELASFQVSLPFVYAFHVGDADQKKWLNELIAVAKQDEMKTWAAIQKGLIGMGAQKFLISAAYLQKQKAMALLSSPVLQPYDRSPLLSFLQNLFPFVPA